MYVPLVSSVISLVHSLTYSVLSVFIAESCSRVWVYSVCGCRKLRLLRWDSFDSILNFTFYSHFYFFSSKFLFLNVSPIILSSILPLTFSLAVFQWCMCDWICAHGGQKALSLLGATCHGCWEFTWVLVRSSCPLNIRFLSSPFGYLIKQTTFYFISVKTLLVCFCFLLGWGRREERLTV